LVEAVIGDRRRQPGTSTYTIQAGVGCHRDTEAQPPHPGLYGTGAPYAPAGHPSPLVPWQQWSDGHIFELRRFGRFDSKGSHVQREIDLIVLGWLSSDDDKWFRIDINKSIARPSGVEKKITEHQP